MPYISNIQPQTGFAGQISDSNPYAIITKTNVNATLTIPFGVAMILDGTNVGYNLPTASNQITNRMAINAIAQRTQNAGYVSGVWTAGDTSGTAPGVAASGVVQGDMYVTVEETVLLGDPCFIRFAAGSGGNVQLGAFRKSADVVSAAATAAVHPDWYYATAASAGGVAVVRCS